MFLPLRAWKVTVAQFLRARFAESRKPRSLKPRSLTLESLEPRQMMAGIGVNITYGSLTLTAGWLNASPVAPPCDTPVTTTTPTAPNGTYAGVPDSSTGNSAAAFGPNGVNYANGQVELVGSSLSAQTAMGTMFGQTLLWTNLSVVTSVFGRGMQSQQLPQLVSAGGSSVAFIDGPTTRWFDYSDSAYQEEFYYQDTLTYSSSTDEFTLADPAGDTFVFHDFSSSLPSAEQGTLVSMSDAAGNSATVTSVNTAGNPLNVELSSTTGGVTTTDDYQYAYISSGGNAGLCSSVMLERTVGSADPFEVQEADYTYYSSGAAYGETGDLELAQIKDAGGDILDTTYYRYYTSAGSGGYSNGLEYMFSNDSYLRAVAAVGGDPADVLTAGNSTVSPFADDALQYDSELRVTEMVVQGTGCSVCDAGLGTFQFAYSESSLTPGYNTWSYKTVETLPNDTTNTVYSNFAGQALLDVQDADSQEWLTAYHYTSTGELSETDSPSAVASYNDPGTSTALSVSLNSSSGLISTTEYYSSTTATTSTPGGVAGDVENTYVQEGTGGTPILQSTTTYIANTDSDSNTLYFVAAETVYSTTTATSPSSSGAETTSYAYTFYSGTNEIEQITTSLPPVTDQNSGFSSVTDTTKAFFDAFGREIWDRDADGNISYTAYDPATGAVIETVVDVGSSEATALGGLPSGWSVLSGSHLDLISTNVVDALGRTTMYTDPDGNITFTVFDDPDHEVRIYQGWTFDSETSKYAQMSSLPPTQVEMDDLVGTEDDSPVLYSETLTMSAPLTSEDLDATTGAPLGTEEIADVQSLSRHITNNASQVVEEDDYFDLSSLSYSDSTATSTLVGVQLADAVQNTNYYVTAFQYSHLGELDRAEDPDGNITREVYDGLGREASVWVGTDDAPITIDDVTYYWTPGGTENPDWNMVETTQLQYDNGSIGDSNVTQVINFESEGGSLTITPEVTQLFNDWRDRLVATKQGVLLDDYYLAAGDEQTYTEDTSGETSSPTTELPITFDTLDNLGEVTSEAVYDGNGVALSYSGGVPESPSSGIESDTAYTYDAQGREYEITRYDGFSGGSPVDGDTTLLLFDANGNLTSSTVPPYDVTSYVYNGAGRMVAEIAPNPDSGGATGGLETVYGYNGEGEVTSVTDPMSNVTSYVYDAAGRMTAEYAPDPSTGASGGPETSYSYDAAGNLASLTDPDDYTTSYAYDALGRETGTSEVVAETSSTTVTAATSIVYDGDNNVLQTTDADGRIIAYTYNDLNQRTEEDWFADSSDQESDTKSNTITTSYDLSGDILTTADTYPTADDAQNSEYTFTYNTLSQQISSDNNGSDPSGTTGTAGVPDVALSSTYDAIGDRLSLDSTIDGTADFQNSYVYDALGREFSVVQQSASGGDGVQYKEVDFGFDGQGRLLDVAGYGAADDGDLTLIELYSYDHDSRLTSVTDLAYNDGYGGPTASDSLTMTYDADSRLTAVSNTDYSAEYREYNYDHDSQLTGADGDGDGGPTASYNFDANGNQTGSGTSVGDGNTQLAGDGYTSTFNAAGEMLTETSTSTGDVDYYTWDNRDRMTSDTRKDSGGVVQFVLTYTYDTFNNIIGRTYTPYSGGVAGATQMQRFVVDPTTGNTLLAFDGSGNLTDRFLWGPLVDQIMADEKVWSTSSPGDLEWMMTDNRGSVSDVVDSTGTLLDHVVYNDFGGIASQTDSTYAPLFGYNGVFTDPVTGLQYHNDPATGVAGRWTAAGRWLSPDPIFPESGSNPYPYGNNAPTNFADPSGLEAPGGFPGYHGAGPNSVARNRAEAAPLLHDLFVFLNDVNNLINPLAHGTRVIRPQPQNAGAPPGMPGSNRNPCKLDQLKQRLDNAQERLSHLEQKLESIRQSSKTQRGTRYGISEGYDTSKTEQNITQVQQEIGELTSQINSLQTAPPETPAQPTPEIPPEIPPSNPGAPVIP